MLLILILGGPPKSMSDYGHTEPKRGAECWGEGLLLTFGWAGIPAFPKVSRCKSGTISSRYLNNGYVLHPKKLPPAFARNPTFSSTLNQLNLR